MYVFGENMVKHDENNENIEQLNGSNLSRVNLESFWEVKVIKNNTG
jgi:hypothetical protein